MPLRKTGKHKIWADQKDDIEEVSKKIISTVQETTGATLRS